MLDDTTDITALLDAWSNDEPGALERLIPHVYEALRRIAHRYFQSENPGITLDPTEVVNELWFSLNEQRTVKWHNRAEFFGVASKRIYRLLVDHARHRQAKKRWGKAIKVPLDDLIPVPGSIREADVIALDDALVDLAKLNPRQSRIVIYRIFGGLTLVEVAAIEKIGRATAHREWNAALLWLRRELGGRKDGGSRGPGSTAGPTGSSDPTGSVGSSGPAGAAAGAWPEDPPDETSAVGAPGEAGSEREPHAATRTVATRS